MLRMARRIAVCKMMVMTLCCSTNSKRPVEAMKSILAVSEQPDAKQWSGGARVLGGGKPEEGLWSESTEDVQRTDTQPQMLVVDLAERPPRRNYMAPLTNVTASPGQGLLGCISPPRTRRLAEDGEHSKWEFGSD